MNFLEFLDKQLERVFKAAPQWWDTWLFCAVMIVIVASC
jgi:hypothetical protein